MPFRNWVKKDGSSTFTPEKGRYHLYVAYSCPFSCRAIIARALFGLEDSISMDVADPILDRPKSWSFLNSNPELGTTRDTVNGCSYLKEIYHKVDPNYEGPFTVPVLWDKVTGTIVSNESADILRMFHREFKDLHTRNQDLDLYPTDLQKKIGEMNDWIGPTVNSGVYRCGFAEKQEQYNENVVQLFESLDRLEEILGKSKFLCGDQFSECDIRLFTTLIRFDVVYYLHFKCSKRHIYEYPNLWDYTRGIYQNQFIRPTVCFKSIIQSYYLSQRHVNPFGIIPIGPNPKDLQLDRPSTRKITQQTLPIS